MNPAYQELPMNRLSILTNELTGARVTIPFTALRRFGPRHHAIVLGTNTDDGQLWIAELSRRFGYRLVELNQWLEDNREYLDGLKIEPNSGPRANIDIARSAIQEVESRDPGGSGYDVLFNNCETFADRQIRGETSLSPQVRKAAQILGFVVAGGMLILRKSLKRRFLF